jgi:hypothetical protein
LGEGRGRGRGMGRGKVRGRGRGRGRVRVRMRLKKVVFTYNIITHDYGPYLKILVTLNLIVNMLWIYIYKINK